MLRTVNDQPTLWEAILPEALLGLPVELEAVDALLDDTVFFEPYRAHFHATLGRPSVPIETTLGTTVTPRLRRPAHPPATQGPRQTLLKGSWRELDANAAPTPRLVFTTSMVGIVPRAGRSDEDEPSQMELLPPLSGSVQCTDFAGRRRLAEGGWGV